MKTKITIYDTACPKARQLSKQPEGFNTDILSEILMLNDEDFSPPMSAERLIECLKQEGFL
jgi:hypothetical protein